MSFIDTANTIVGYIPQGIAWLRDFLIRQFGSDAIFIAYLIISLILGYVLVKKLNTAPLTGRFIGWYLLISLLFFLTLMYV